MNDVLQQPVQIRPDETSTPGTVQLQRCEGLGIEILKYLQTVAKIRPPIEALPDAGFQESDAPMLAALADDLCALNMRELLRIGLMPRLWIDSVTIDEQRLCSAFNQSQNAAWPRSRRRSRSSSRRSAPHADLVKCYLNRLTLYSVEKLASSSICMTVAVRRFGVSYDACARLLNASSHQLRAIANAPVCILSVQVNWQRLVKLLIQIKNDREAEILQNRLLTNRAPFEFMQKLYGWNTHAFAERRARIGLTETGRPKSIPDDLLQTVVDHWRDAADLPIAEQYLYVSEVSGYCIASLVGADIEKIVSTLRRRTKA